MRDGTTVFLLKSDVQGARDGSMKGIGLTQSSKVKTRARDSGFQFKGGSIDLVRHKSLDSLQAFTIEATINPEVTGVARMNIIEGQVPAIACFISDKKKLVGSVHTASGWQGVDSGATVVEGKKKYKILFSRDSAGKMLLEINGKKVGTKSVQGTITPVGRKGLKIGTWVDGRRYPFKGTIADVKLVQGVVSKQQAKKELARAKQIQTSFIAKTGLKLVNVTVLPDYGNSRLQQIKDIMNAAGVEKLSDLDTLKITTKTILEPGKVIIASKKKTSPQINWSDMVKGFRNGNLQKKHDLISHVLPNRNSTKQLKKRISAAAVHTPSITFDPRLSRIPISGGGRLRGLGSPAATGFRIPPDALRSSITLRRAATETLHPADMFEKVDITAKLVDAEMLKRINSDKPSLWANISNPSNIMMSIQTIPVDSAVMIGDVIDLTNVELVVEPKVSTLYIIANKLICGANAKITWRGPGGSTPPRLDNPDLDGRGYSGVHQKPNSRDGLDGGDGLSGEPGIGGAAGLRAPNLEIWVKDMSAMPDIDLNGEDGITGGKGQRGGRGGNGADGHVGRRYWFFGWHCSTDPGDGGDGGDGGRGGRGGHGGNGGNGGKLTIGVLENTLETTVSNNTFKIKNQGGQEGRGGQGGAGGNGGYGGRSGSGETCHDADDGHPGAKGQPGTIGQDGTHTGTDGYISLLEFTIDEWDALLTRPWISEVTPDTIFPGDMLTLKGSRFSSADRVHLAGFTLSPTINADESVSVVCPLSIPGGSTNIYIRRQDGTESNRLTIWVKPQLDIIYTALVPGTEITLRGRAFKNGAAVLVDGSAAPSTVINPGQLTFMMPGTGGTGGGGNTVTVQVRNPDGMISNSRSASIPRILEIPFTFGVHNLPFGNFTDGVPDWGTFEDSYGAAEVWHELLDPIFGHPVLTAAFYGFYCYYLKGTANGGLATGFCTSLASLVADNFWQGRTDTHTITKASVHKKLTAVHGKLLSRESLIHFHDQGRTGVSRVERSAREVEAAFLRGCDRNNAPLIFFIPSGTVWDSGYFDTLASSHCVMPYKFVYPTGHPGPQLSADGSLTVTSLDGVEMYVWDCNNPSSPDCRLVFSETGGVVNFEFFSNSTTAQFNSQDGITLGMMTNGAYMLSDHDLPFSGPFGLTAFILDFLLSPADLQILDSSGLRTGNFGGQIRAEIPDSHPCYLVPGAYLLPVNTALTRRIVGSGTGTYSYNSIMPDGGSIVLQDVETVPGQVDELSVSADGTQIRFAPAVDKVFQLTVSRQVGTQARAIAVKGIGGGPGAEVDITISPELSLARIGNRGAARNVEVRVFVVDHATNSPLNRQYSAVNLAQDHDLVISVEDWGSLDADVQTLAF